MKFGVVKMYIAMLVGICGMVLTMFDTGVFGVFTSHSVKKHKPPVICMNKTLIKNHILSTFKSRSYLHCITQCHVAEGCHAALYKDKECTQSKLPSPQISVDTQEQRQLHRSMSHFPIHNDKTTNSSWIIIQRRLDATTDFYRGWQEYVEGFGNLTHNFWLGLENIHLLTNMVQTEIFISMDTFEGEQFYARYDHFSVGSAANGYALSISGYSGSAGDSMVADNTYGTHHGMKFSTYDNDQDEKYYNCAERYKGAWWYSSCHSSNLNGLYLSKSWGEGINWMTAKGYNYSMKTTIMMIRKKV